MLLPGDIASIIGEAWRAHRAKKAQRLDMEERRKIARAFNDRYTYLTQYDKSRPWLDNKELLSATKPGGNAWMCPDCNKIHFPLYFSVMSGLQYPACCFHPQGYRFDEISKRGGGLA